MIISAQIIESDVLPQPLPAPSVPRGDPAYPMDPWDFIQYHRSGRRWLNAAPWELKDHVSNTEAIRLLALNTVSAGSHYAHRPATFPYTRLECPICCSISHSKVCRACGRSRVSKTDTRPWNGNMKYCATWAQQQDDANRRIISDDVWERGIAAAASLASDYAANELLTGSQCRNLLTGVWHDSATGLDIPLRTVLDCIPSATGAYSDYLCSLSLAEDSDPNRYDCISHHSPYNQNTVYILAVLYDLSRRAVIAESSGNEHIYPAVGRRPR